MSSRAALIFLIALLLSFPSGSALTWKAARSGDLYISAEWRTAMIPVENPHVSAGEHLIVWNSTVVYDLDEDKIYPFEDVDGIWQHGNSVAVSNHGRVTFLNMSGERVGEVNATGVMRVAIYWPWAAIVSSENIMVNLQNISVRRVDGEFLGAGDGVFLFSADNTLRVWENGEVLEKNMGSRILGAARTPYGYFVLCEDGLHFLNSELAEEDHIESSAREIHLAGDSVVLVDSRKDDEGKRYWIFTFYGATDGRITKEGEGITYLAPEEIFDSAGYLVFHDSKYLHLMNESVHIFTNFTFDDFDSSQGFLAGIRGNTAYRISIGEIVETLRYEDGDADNDWIPNSRDYDADNDGMPNWWEEKYGLNPLNPGDRSKDPDHDGLTNYQEYLNGTNPRNRDTDCDGLSDGYEVSSGTNPLRSNITNEIVDRRILLISLAILASILIVLGSKKE